MSRPSSRGQTTSKKPTTDPVRHNEPTSSKGSREIEVEIPMKTFFNFLRTAYQLQEATQGNGENHLDFLKVDWDELEKDPVVKKMIENCLNKNIDATASRRGSEGGSALEFLELAATSSNTYVVTNDVSRHEQRRNSLNVLSKKNHGEKKHNSEIEDKGMESVLMAKLNDVLNQGMLDSVLSYMVSYSKINKEKNAHQSIIKKPSLSNGDIKKPASFSGFLTERESKEKLGIPSRDKLGRRKSSITTEKGMVKQDSEVEIHVCDEVKGLKRDFRCPQKLLVSKMGYFADVTSGQKLEDMDISVHCDIQIFDWLMRWVKKDTILVADWPILEPTNVVPILVSASFLQMDPLVHDCLIYCHGHINEIVKTHTNLGCLNDTILTRLGAMYTNSELETIKDKKDKIISRLYTKMILSLGEPVPETLRGHYSSLANVYSCSCCSKLLSKQAADRILCQPSNMNVDRRGYIISTHSRDQNWNLNDHIMSLYSEIMSWRKVYWRLWGECHALKCSTCDNHFSVNQMEWCCYHPEMPQFFSPDPAKSMCLPIGRYPCCSQRAYRFQVLNQQQSGCQFREHTPIQRTDYEVGVLYIYNSYKHVIASPPPKLTFPERMIRLVTRDSSDTSGKLNCQEVFWWEGVKLAPTRQPLGLLGKLYSGNIKSHGLKQASNINNSNTNNVSATAATFLSSLTPKTGTVPPEVSTAPEEATTKTSGENVSSTVAKTVSSTNKIESGDEEDSSDSSSTTGTSSSTTNESSSSSSEDSSHSEEGTPHRVMTAKRVLRKGKPKVLTRRRCGASGGRMWAAALSARSNQDHQRQYEERTGRQMRALLSKRVSGQVAINQDQPLGGVYVRLEAEWKESVSSTTLKTRPTYSAKALRMKNPRR